MSRMPRRAITTAAAGLVVAVLPAAGCSPDGGRADPVAVTDLAAAPRNAVRDGGTLRWAVDTVPTTLNVFQPAADDTTAMVTGAVLPTLFRLDGQGRPRRDPDFLRAADVVARTSRQVVAYRLNPKAVWSDGRPIGAADFAAQWKALRGRDDAFRTARNAGYDRIADVRQGADAHEVRVTFLRPFADWRSLFTPLYPRSVTGTADAFNQARTRLPAGAGPFTVRAVAARRTVTLARNPRWWGARAKLDTLVLTAVPHAARPAALAAGRLDVAELDPAAYTALAKATAKAAGKAAAQAGPTAKPVKARALTLHKARGAAYTQLALNGGSGPLADERVRRAVARALDRRAIAESVLKPLGLPAEPLGNHLVLASQDGYADHSSALGTADAKSARAMLAEAGWHGTRTDPVAAGNAAPGRDVPALHKNGRPLTLRLVLPRSSATLTRVGGRIATMLATIGIRTDIRRVADDSFFRDHIAAGDFDLALYSWPGTPYPATDDRPIFAKPEPAADGTLTVEQNYSRVGTDQIDQLLDRAAAELDPGTARELANRADARIWAAAGSVPLFQRPQLVALAPGVANAGAFGFAAPRYEDIGFLKRPPARDQAMLPRGASHRLG